MATAAQKKALAKAEKDNTLPAHLRDFGNVGNENVTQSDIVIPRLGIIQATSPELDADDAKYIDGAKQGMFFNSLTREVFEEIRLCNIFYEMQYIIWRLRDFGGGFRGMGESMSEAVALLEALEDKDNCEIQDTANHYCIVVDDKGNLVLTGGQVYEIAVPMKSTGMKHSRNWNSLIRMKGGPRFAGTWLLKTAKEENDKGKYFNFSISPGPFTSAEAALNANKVYEAIKAGQRKIDDKDGGDKEEPTSDKY